MTVGLRLLASLIDSEKGLDDYIKFHMEPELFQSEAEAQLYAMVSTHVLKYGSLPKRSTLKGLGFALLPSKQPEPPQFYFDKCKERYVFSRLKSMLKTIEGDLNDDQPNVALDRMVETMSLCQMFVQKDRIVEVTQAMQKTLPTEYHKKYTAVMKGLDYGLLLGWKTFDTMTGGLQPGDLIAVVGRPGAGKTYLMLHGANTSWLNNRPPMVVTMEMPVLEIMQRVGAMLTRTPIKKLKHALLTNKQLINMTDNLAMIAAKEVPYYVVDGALTATVSDVILMARQLKPGAVFIDGAYLLRNNSPKLSRWEKLTENLERLKSELAMALGIPVVVSYQLNRQAAKRGHTAGLEDVAYTDALGQLASVVLGMMQEENVENIATRAVDIMKGRNGETGQFRVNWNFDMGPHYMRFDEAIPTGTIEFK